MGLMNTCFTRSINIKACEIVSIILHIHNKYVYIYIYIYIYAYIYIYISINVQACAWIQTVTLWISYGHPPCNKRADNRLNFIHNHTHYDLNIQDRNRSLLLNEFEESWRVSSHSILITLLKAAIRIIIITVIYLLSIIVELLRFYISVLLQQNMRVALV